MFERPTLKFLRTPVVLAILTTCTLAQQAEDDGGIWPAVARFDFEDGSMDGWTFTDPNAWRITASTAGRHALEQFQASDYEPKVRSPFNIALVPELTLADFEMSLRVRSTARDYGHRDVCLIFGYQDPSHFYYVHLGKEADPHAHSIFLVNDQPRVSIAEERTSGTPWTDGWHHVKLVRRIAEGLVEVYFEDMSTPIMKTRDKTFSQGRVGLGTFDDTALFDDLVIRGQLIQADHDKD